jgi:organic hydroperoxide reductase OsmC/OhrA
MKFKQIILAAIAATATVASPQVFAADAGFCHSWAAVIKSIAESRDAGITEDEQEKLTIDISGGNEQQAMALEKAVTLVYLEENKQSTPENLAARAYTFCMTH